MKVTNQQGSNVGQFFAPALVETVSEANPTPRTAMTQAIVDSDFTRALEAKLSAFIESRLPQVRKALTEPILRSWSELISHTFPFINKEEQNDWILHFITLMLRETDAKFSSSSFYSGNVKFQGKNVLTRAYGYLQHTRGNWEHHATNFRNGKWGKLLAQQGVFKKFANTLGVAEEELWHPHAFYGPPNDPVYQLVPLMGQFQMLYDTVTNRWKWDPASGAWITTTCKYPERLAELKKAMAPGLANDPIVARQGLITMLSANGTGFTNLAHTPNHMDRIALDMQAFADLRSKTNIPELLP